MRPAETLDEPLAVMPAPLRFPEPANRGLQAAWALRKYFRIFRTSLIERMTYRGDFLLGTVLRFLPMVTTILLWQAIYAGARNRSLSGFTFEEMVAYLLLVHISRMFSSMPGLAGGIARDIREGTLKKYLIQPLDMIGYLVSYRAAHKVAYIATSAIPYAVVFLICSSFFMNRAEPITMVTVMAYIASLLMGFVIGFFFEVTIGMIGFWLLEVTSLLYIITTVSFFISGQMFPLDLLPSPWNHLLKALPFQYMAYFPAAVFLGKVKGQALAYGLVAQVVWSLLFIVLARWLYRMGLKRYSAFGG
jgi:ABC-2 type transport system permease protein